MAKIIESVAWFLWFSLFMFNNWNNSALMKTLLISVVAAIPFVIIGLKIWLKS